MHCSPLGVCYPSLNIPMTSVTKIAPLFHETFLDQLQSSLGLHHISQLCDVDWESLKRVKGGTFYISQYDDSMCHIAATAYPDYPWQPWTFAISPPGFWKDRSHQLGYLSWLGEQLNISKPEDWYGVTIDVVSKHKGHQMLMHHNGSLADALQDIYPNYSWQPWRFARAKRGLWDYVDNQRDYLVWLATKLKIDNPEGWYQVQYSEFVEHDGWTLINMYGGSTFKMIHSLYPWYEWQPWLFVKVPSNFWEEAENQFAYMEWVAQQLHLTKLDDWYHVHMKDIQSLCGNNFFWKFDSLYHILAYVYPQHRWYPWKFEHLPNEFWDNLNNQKHYMGWVAEQMNVSCPNDWYYVRTADILDRKGSLLLEKYFTVSNTLMNIYPLYPWIAWKFDRVPSGFWDNMENQRRLLEWLSIELNIETADQWHNVNSTTVRNMGFTTLLYQYGTLYEMLKTAYPDYEWNPWEFAKLPNGWWLKSTNVDRYAAWLQQQMQIFTPEDLFWVTAGEIFSLHGSKLIALLGGLYPFLQRCFPHLITTEYFDKSGRISMQKRLFRLIQRLSKVLDVNDMQMNAILPTLYYDTGRPMELDVYLPTHRLSLEYQGEQHYSKTFWSTDFVPQQQRDLAKKRSCASANITLIAIPYWWDKGLDSLIATIHAIRPDLIKECATTPIPMHPPSSTEGKKSLN